ncbi:MAG: Rossmann-like and DUF2520 domain-containing protein [Bacteroidia bacterium]|nr:Rossmann-like and DUF2520 domain-containing protein [Bacteroidia bacterium]
MEPTFWRVAIVGAGNLAWSLIPNLQRTGAEVTQLITRDTLKGLHWQDVYGIPGYAQTPEALDHTVNLVWLTLPDRLLSGVAAQLAPLLAPDTICIHSSGSVPVDALAPAGVETAVLYPLQIFTRQQVVDMRETPLLAECHTDRLMPLATALSAHVRPMDSAARLRAHLGAVFACNFPNYLFTIAAALNPDQDITLYGPLIREHINRVLAQGPVYTQTGPAIRGDRPVLDRHLELLLSLQPEWAELYVRLSAGIRPEVWTDV